VVVLFVIIADNERESQYTLVNQSNPASMFCAILGTKFVIVSCESSARLKYYGPTLSKCYIIDKHCWLESMSCKATSDWWCYEMCYRVKLLVNEPMSWSHMKSVGSYVMSVGSLIVCGNI
jgi:hypothetical protein